MGEDNPIIINITPNSDRGAPIAPLAVCVRCGETASPFSATVCQRCNGRQWRISRRLVRL